MDFSWVNLNLPVLKVGSLTRFSCLRICLIFQARLFVPYQNELIFPTTFLLFILSPIGFNYVSCDFHYVYSDYYTLLQNYFSVWGSFQYHFLVILLNLYMNSCFNFCAFGHSTYHQKERVKSTFMNPEISSINLLFEWRVLFRSFLLDDRHLERSTSSRLFLSIKHLNVPVRKYQNIHFKHITFCFWSISRSFYFLSSSSINVKACSL